MNIHIGLALLLLSLMVNAQTEEILADSISIDNILFRSNDFIVDPVAPKPEYPGGYDSLVFYLESNNRLNGAEGVKGKVYVHFVVEVDGSTTNVEVIRGLMPECDQEALRLIQNIPEKWKPAMKQGIPVRTSMVIPITFSIKK